MLTDLVLRISGIVAFSDNTHGKFGVIWQDGSIVEPLAAESLESFKQFWGQESTVITNLLESLGGTFTITTLAPSTQKVLTSWTVLIDGGITRSDGTSGNFNAVIDPRGGARVTGSAVFEEVLADSAYKTIFDTVLEAIAGSGKVSIA